MVFLALTDSEPDVTTELEKLERRWQEHPQGLTFAPLAEAYRKAGKIARALELLDSGLAQHSGYVPAHIVRGRCHLDAGEAALAELDFLCAVELDPENVIALQALADLAEREGRIADAIRRLEALLEVDRTNEEARGHLGRLREEVVVAPISAPELRLRNDSLGLHPAPDRIPGIENLDIELSLPRLMPEEPGAVLAPEPQPEAAFPEPAATGLGVGAAETRLEGPREPAAGPHLRSQPEPEPEPQPEPEPRPEPEPEPEAESEPALLVTETMAEIFLRQGHGQLALAVYTQLLQRDPGDERIALAVAELSGQLGQALAGQVEELPRTEPPPPSYEAAKTGGRSVGAFLASLLSASRPSPGEPVHPPTFKADPPSFDEFFSSSAESSQPPPAPVEPEPADDPRRDDAEDLEQFNAWLRGFKG